MSRRRTTLFKDAKLLEKKRFQSFSYLSTECCGLISPCGSAMEYFAGAVHNTKDRTVINT